MKKTKEEFHAEVVKMAKKRGQEPIDINDPLFDKVYEVYFNSPENTANKEKLFSILHSIRDYPLSQNTNNEISEEFALKLVKNGSLRNGEIFSGPFPAFRGRNQVACMFLKSKQEKIDTRVYSGFSLRKLGSSYAWTPSYWLESMDGGEIYDPAEEPGILYMGIELNRINFIKKSLSLSDSEIQFLLS